ncbi:MAG: hypothetical protein ACT4QA_14525 [Panacagrimonas sp.]
MNIQTGTSDTAENICSTDRKRRTRLGLLLGSLALLGCFAPEAKEPFKARVTLLSQGPERVVPAGIFGTNLQWESEGDGLLRGRKDRQIPPPLVADIRALNPSSIRFPGGLLANTYRWKSGIGPRGTRAKGLNFNRQPVDSSFGTDEFIPLLAATGAAPLITVNLAAGSEEAADWVEYLNGAPETRWGKERQKNVGVQSPRAVYWEIGNELYSPHEPDHLSAEAYAAKVKEFALAMKKRDPGIRVGATLEGAFQEAAWMAQVMPDLTTWNERVLKAIGPEVDFLSLHFYVPFDKLGNEQDLNRLVWAGPLAFERTLSRIREQAARHGRPKLEIAVTEFGTFFDEKTTLSERIAGTENAIFNTLLTLTFMRQAEVSVANHWSLLNNGMFGMLTWEGDTLGRRPWHEAYVRLREFAGARLLPIKLESEGFKVGAKGNVPEMANVPALDAVVVEAKGQMRLALVNRSPDREIKLTLDAGGGKFPPKFNMTTLSSERKQRQWAQPVAASLAPSESGHYKLRLPPQSIAFLGSASF